MQLPADGQLPTLHLSETSTADKGAVKGRGMHPLALAGLVALSFCASVGLLMLDSDGRGGVVRQGDYLRNQIAGYYTDKAEPLEPYQADLREAQQAYSRGDLKTEQAYYRRVLDLLRAEGRSRFRGLTGTPDSDRKLEKLLADLLALERAASPDDSG